MKESKKTNLGEMKKLSRAEMKDIIAGEDTAMNIPCVGSSGNCPAQRPNCVSGVCHSDASTMC